VKFCALGRMEVSFCHFTGMVRVSNLVTFSRVSGVGLALRLGLGSCWH